MGCVIEMLFCDQCGREVERHHIYVVKNKEGQREFICPECAGKEKVTANSTSKQVETC